MSHSGATLTGVVLASLVIYVVLRLTHVSSDASASPQRLARRHAIWAALIALVAGPVIGESPLTLLSQPSYFEVAAGTLPATYGDDLVATAVPFMALGGVYILAQFTGPIVGGGSRSADLSVRHIRDYVPWQLAVFAAVMVVIGGVALALTARLPAMTPPSQPQGTSTFAPTYQTGRVDGSYFASVALASYGLFVVMVVLAVLVIVRRGRVATLTRFEDSIIRRAFVNRLLRSSAMVGVIATHNCVDFAAIGPGAENWDTLRIVVSALALLTVIVVIATRPTMDASHLEEQPIPPASWPPTPISHAVQVIRSGRTLGFAAWTACMIPILLAVGSPLDGLLGLAVLTVGFLCLIGPQLVAELTLVRRQVSSRTFELGRVRGLPRELLITAVPAGASVLGVLGLGMWLSPIPRNSPELLLWFIALGLTLATATFFALVSAARPTLRGMTRGEDRTLRTASVRRAMLFTQSAMLAFAAFALSDNRYALVPASGDGNGTAIGLDAYPPDQGALGGVVVALMLTAVVLAVLPGRRGRRAVPARSTNGAAP